MHDACIYRRKTSCLLHASCFFFLVADLREIIRCRSITVSSHFNFSKNIRTEIILNHIFHFQNSFITGLPVGQTQLLLRFSVVSAEKRTPGKGKTRGSGTKKQWSFKWFHTIFPCTDPCTNIFWNNGHFWTQTMGEPLWKKLNFSTFWTSYFYSLERRFLVLEYRKTHFPGLYCLKKKSCKKSPFLDQNHGLTPLKNLNFSTF